MKFKRLLSLVTVCTFVFSFLFSSIVSAEDGVETTKNITNALSSTTPSTSLVKRVEKIDKERVIEIAKTMLENPNDYDVGSIGLNPNWSSNGSAWSVDFYLKVQTGGNINVVIDATTGQVIGFNMWENYDNQKNHVATMTKSEARLKAEEYISNQLKLDISTFELQKDITYGNNYYGGNIKQPVTYNYSYFKKINGIPFMNYGITIGVDGTTGKIRSFNITNNDIDAAKFPLPENIIKADEALINYKDGVNVMLQYVLVYNKNPYGYSSPKVILAYIPQTYTNMIDAITGKPLNYDGSVLDTNIQYAQLLDNPVTMDPNAKLEDRVINEDEASQKAEERKKIVENIFGITFDENMGNSFYIPYPASQENIWNYNWNKNVGTQNTSFNLSINGKTGHITGMNLYNYDYANEVQMKQGQEQTPIVEKVTWQQGKEKSLEYIKKLLPEQYGFYTDENLKTPDLNAESLKYMREYTYSFTRVINGIRYRDNSINVSIDRQTGDVRNLYMAWGDVEFPMFTGKVTSKEAENTFFKNIEAKLAYSLKVTYSNKGMPAYAETPNLVYAFSNGAYMGGLMVDSDSGKLVDWSDTEIKPVTTPGEPPLADHWAKRSVELLIAQGIIANPNVEYDISVTRAEIIKMFSLAKLNIYYEGIPSSVKLNYTDVSADDQYYYYIENAVRQKILTETGGEFKGNEKITKLEFVKLLVNLMGYSDIAKYKDIFKTNDAINVSTDLVGYVAICSALGVLPVKEGQTFNGNELVTYGEAATALYKALQFIK